MRRAERGERMRGEGGEGGREGRGGEDTSSATWAAGAAGGTAWRGVAVPIEAVLARPAALSNQLQLSGSGAHPTPEDASRQRRDAEH